MSEQPETIAAELAAQVNGRRLEAVGADRLRDMRMTDIGNARRFVREHRDDLRYVPGLGWHAWDGKRWRYDDDGEVLRRAGRTVGTLLAEAIEEPDTELREHAKASASRRRLEAMVALAAVERPVIARVDELNADPWLFTCANGTLDLGTGTLREHRRGDLITKLAPVAYDREATCPTWDGFLATIFAGDEELIAFLQRAAGYSLTGLSREHVLLFCHGPGANGKTTFLRTLQRVAGEWAIQAEPDLLLAKRSETHPTGLADLFGVRLSVCVEVDEGRRFAESLVKLLTGGDKLRARRMRQDFFEFEPHHTIWLGANHKPTVRGTDNAIWRRIKLVPFTVTIPPNEQDSELLDKLAAELPGILAWAVRGAIKYAENGLTAPAVVEAATTAYRNEQDVLGAFFEDRCLLDPGAEVKASDLYSAYTAWCEAAHEHVLRRRDFGLRLGELGFEPHKGAKGSRWWRGIGLSEATP